MRSKQDEFKQFCVDLGLFIRDLWPGTTGLITGGTITAVITIFSMLGGTLPAWMVWGFVSLAFFASAFGAWRKEYNKVRAKNSLTTLTAIVDLVVAERKKHPSYSEIAALIKHSYDFNTEDEVKWMCEQLDRNHFKNPFLWMETQSGGAFNGKWLQFLREARLSGKEFQFDFHAWEFAITKWSDAESVQRGHSKIFFKQQ